MGISNGMSRINFDVSIQELFRVILIHPAILQNDQLESKFANHQQETLVKQNNNEVTKQNNVTQ